MRPNIYLLEINRYLCNNEDVHDKDYGYAELLVEKNGKDILMMLYFPLDDILDRIRFYPPPSQGYSINCGSDKKYIFHSLDNRRIYCG